MVVVMVIPHAAEVILPGLVVQWNLGHQIPIVLDGVVTYYDCPFKECATQHMIKPPDMGCTLVEITDVLFPGQEGLGSSGLFDVLF